MLSTIPRNKTNKQNLKINSKEQHLRKNSYKAFAMIVTKMRPMKTKVEISLDFPEDVSSVTNIPATWLQVPL